MKLLTNRKVKKLFCWALLLLTVFPLLSVVLVTLNPENTILYILLCSFGMGLCILAVGYQYFKEQNKIMENAITQIRDYLSGNRDARIECNDEGELFRLFHEVNALVSILNAHAENEGKARGFLKSTISDISHQLKTPLAALNIYNGILQEEAEQLPTIKEFTALSEQELDRIETLVQNLLKIAKLDAGTIILEKNKETVAEMIGCIQKHFSYRAQQEEKELQLRGDDTVTLLCDRTWWLEAISNLVKNAFDHTQKGDSIHIEWRKFVSIVQILIKDTGSGIHPEDFPHIFKRFYRSRFSKDIPGVGLGLPLAKSIIEAHGGTITVDSTPGIGTTFTISFLNDASLYHLRRVFGNSNFQHGGHGRPNGKN